MLQQKSIVLFRRGNTMWVVNAYKALFDQHSASEKRKEMKNVSKSCEISKDFRFFFHILSDGENVFQIKIYGSN